MLKLIDIIFLRISAEKLKELAGLEGKANIKADVKIKEVEKRDIERQKDKKILEIFFIFDVNYEPGVARITIEGKVIAGADKNEAEEVIKEWKKSKAIKDVRVYNIILHKCNLRALQLEDELKLPSHIPLPIIKPEVVEEKK